MKQPPADSSHPWRRSRSGASASQRWSNGLKNLGLLLLGFGLGAAGTSWFAPKTASSTSATKAKGVLDSPRFAQSDTSSSQTQTSEPPSLQTGDVASATVCVKVKAGPSEESCASGVSIDPQLAGIDAKQGAVVLTNYHVVFDMGGRVPLQLGGKGQVFESKLIRQSPEFDLALLLVPKAQFPVAALADASPGKGTAVRAIGFPNNAPLTVKESSLLGETQTCLSVSPCLALAQGTITYGNSGGPLEADGKVIGITEGELADEIAIPVEQVRQFLSGQVPSANRRSRQFESDFPAEEREPDYFPPQDRFLY